MNKSDCAKPNVRKRGSPTLKIGDVFSSDITDSVSPVERQGVRGKTNPGKSLTSPCNGDLGQYSYWLTRVVLLRYISFVYAVAFTVALLQNEGLLSSRGLLPANNYLSSIDKYVNGALWRKLAYAPTLLWFVDYHDDETFDFTLTVISYIGLCVSLIVLCTGAANMIAMLLLWVLYHSLVNIGQTWYSFGWESQLLESGFLAIFLCPVLSFTRLPADTKPPVVVIWAYRWLIFRIMIGAGLIKIRGDRCWRDLTCMYYHYETQPVPNPLSYFLHQTPLWWHQIETMGNHVVELLAPVLLLLPFRYTQILGGCIQILFQVVLILSGNLSFLNWLTILPCLACFDDKALSFLFPRTTVQKLSSLNSSRTMHKGHYIRKTMDLSLAVLLAYLSVPVVQNLLSSRQAMNTSFDSLRLVNTYGAFGSVTKERTEVIVQGTHDNPNSPNAVWLEYDFKCKPGNVTRRPCVISPYHYRLDWLMWFSAFQNYQQNPWLIHLVAKLLVNDPITENLIERNPFKGQDPPKFIRLEHYKYKYSRYGADASKTKWWTRKKIGSYMPAVKLHDLSNFIKQMGWRLPSTSMS